MKTEEQLFKERQKKNSKRIKRIDQLRDMLNKLYVEEYKLSNERLRLTKEMELP